MPTTAPPPLIAMEHISKTFGSICALDDVSIEAAPGEVHAVVGENGAGKSTLVNILYGHIPPDAGRILHQGVNVLFRSPAQAIRAGIGMVHQQLLLFPQLSVLENVILGQEPSGLGFVQRREAVCRIEKLCGRCGFEIPLSIPAGELPFGKRQQIEILKILFSNARILILDEPTALLSPAEIEALLRLIIRLKEEDHAILFISHRLSEVFTVADRITVLRKGRSSGPLTTSQTTPEEISRLMFGEADGTAQDEPTSKPRVTTSPPFGRHVTGMGMIPANICTPPILTVTGLTAAGTHSEAGLQNLSFQVRRGEVLGIGAVVGNGERTLFKALIGALPVDEGSVKLGGMEITELSIGKRMRTGLQALPAHIQEEALLLGRPIWENMILGRHGSPNLRTGCMLRKGKAVSWAREILSSHHVQYGSETDAVDGLSGGNQQKIALARILADSPPLVILEQPCRGLDMVSRDRIHATIRDGAALGRSCLIISYDLDELLTVADRIGILHRGRIMGIVDTGEADRQALASWLVGLNAPEGPENEDDHGP